MADPKQTDRPISVTTPLGPDKLLLIGISGQEAVSRLFRYQLDVLAKVGTDVPFDKLLGQSVTAQIQFHPQEPKKRYLNGICCRVSEEGQDGEFTTYHLEIVPKFWLASRKAQSRIFQQMSVPDILKKVLDGYDAAFELQGTFEKRDYCVQYRETDFNFASRLMEEEGIYYFFKHSDGGHKMVVANTPQSHSDVPDGSKQIYETVAGGNRPEDRIYDWHKLQELRSGKYLLWDHTFELPHKHLEAEQTIQESVSVGKVPHKLKVGGNDNLELYDYPGEYAQRFDGVNPGGGDQAAELQKIFQDNKRTVGIRMEEEAAASIVIQGASTCRQLVCGHKFTLENHFNADGAYVITSVSHSATYDGYRSSRTDEFRYSNQFTCTPFELPFRPARIALKPIIQGTQSAVVVGDEKEEIWPDKYGRVKIKFHWDRSDDKSNSSCWIRVASSWAGKQWGMIQVPRIGQEVIVAFEEGDPDKPIIIGSVYNYEMMPPYKLPENKTQSGIKSRSSLSGGPNNYNEIRFEDKKGKEELVIHAERQLSSSVEASESHSVGGSQSISIGKDRSLSVAGNESISVKKKQTITVDDDRDIWIKKSQREQVDGTHHVTVKGDRNEAITGGLSLGAKSVNEKVDNSFLLESGQEIHLKSGMKVVIEAGTELTIKVGGNFVKLDPSGVTIVGTIVKINSGGAPGSGSDVTLEMPEPPKAAEPPPTQ